MAALIFINTFSEKNVKFFPNTFGDERQAHPEKCSRKGAQRSAPRVGRERKNKLVINEEFTLINLNKSEGKYSPNLPMNIQLLIGAAIIFLLSSIGG